MYVIQNPGKYELRRVHHISLQAIVSYLLILTGGEGNLIFHMRFPTSQVAKNV